MVSPCCAAPMSTPAFSGTSFHWPFSFSTFGDLALHSKTIFRSASVAVITTCQETKQSSKRKEFIISVIPSGPSLGFLLPASLKTVESLRFSQLSDVWTRDGSFASILPGWRDALLRKDLDSHWLLDNRAGTKRMRP